LVGLFRRPGPRGAFRDGLGSGRRRNRCDRGRARRRRRQAAVQFRTPAVCREPQQRQADQDRNRLSVRRDFGAKPLIVPYMRSAARRKTAPISKAMLEKITAP
jgi:hypothetical protein